MALQPLWVRNFEQLGGGRQGDFGELMNIIGLGEFEDTLLSDLMACYSAPLCDLLKGVLSRCELTMSPPTR